MDRGKRTTEVDNEEASFSPTKVFRPPLSLSFPDFGDEKIRASDKRRHFSHTIGLTVETTGEKERKANIRLRYDCL